METAAWMQAVCTFVLVLVTAHYAWHTWQLSKTADKQLRHSQDAFMARIREAEEREKAQAQLGIKLILEELELNLKNVPGHWTDLEDAIFLSEIGFESSKSAFHRLEIAPDCFAKTGKAYVAMKHYNLLLEQALSNPREQKLYREHRVQKLFPMVCQAMKDAVAALRKSEFVWNPISGERVVNEKIKIAPP